MAWPLDLDKLPRRTQIVLAHEWALKTIPLFEKECPGDKHPRQSLEATWKWIVTPTEENLNCATDAGNFVLNSAFRSEDNFFNCVVAVHFAAYTIISSAFLIDVWCRVNTR